VRTLGGEEVWRKRHYRVRAAPGASPSTPGVFQFSVLDSGVISLETWRVLDCAEDLEW
jgi:hypothetical protein